MIRRPPRSTRTDTTLSLRDALPIFEVIIAPRVSQAARDVVASKANVRLLECGEWPAERSPGWDYKRVNGGLLIQSRDIGMITEADLKIVTQRAPTEQEIHDLIFAWKVAKFVKSNAIVYAKNRQTVGVGAGQMSRVNSARIAAIKAEHAGLPVPGAVMASDAFFPFRAGIDNAATARSEARRVGKEGVSTCRSRGGASQ